MPASSAGPAPIDDATFHHQPDAFDIALLTGPATGITLPGAAGPVAVSGETLVRVRAMRVNPADGKWRRGMFESVAKLSFPHVPGYDVAGTVVSGGRLAPGTPILAMLDAFRQGGDAELVAVPTRRLPRCGRGWTSRSPRRCRHRGSPASS